MRDELIRATVAVPVATLLGLALVGSSLRQRSFAAVSTAALVLLALADHLGLWRTWLAAVLAGLASAGMPASSGRSWQRASARAIVLVLVATLITATSIDRGEAEGALASLAEDRSVVIVVAGGLFAIFVAGEIIARVLRPFAARLSAKSAGMESAGRVIGWLERTLLYALVLAGAPDAAALVIAGKSIARFPSFAHESFAEYYLIGSLLSLIAAAGMAVAVRAAIGLTPLPSAAT